MKWNETKYRVLKYLQYRRENDTNNALTARQLAYGAGVNVETLLGHLPFWVKKCRYLSRVTIKGGELLQYRNTIVMINYKYRSLSFGGEKWICWFEKWHPQLADEYFNGLQQHLDSLQVKADSH